MLERNNRRCWASGQRWDTDSYGKVVSSMTEPLITMSVRQHKKPDSLRRRQKLAITMALLVSAIVFAPLTLALYNDGSVFFLILGLLLWLGVSRFIYHLLAPATQTHTTKAAGTATPKKDVKPPQ